MVIHCQKKVKQPELDARMIPIDLDDVLSDEVIKNTVEYTTSDGTILRYGSRFRPITPDGIAALLELVRNVTGDPKAHFYDGLTVMAPRNWLDAPTNRPQNRPIYAFSISYQGRVSFMKFEYDSGKEYVLVFYRGQLDCMCRDEFDERFTTGKE